MASDQLSGTIRGHHLEPEALAAYRAEFEHHPARLLVVEDFLESGPAGRLQRFLTDEAEFYKEFGLYSVEGAVDQERWEAAPEDDRFFRMGKLAGVPDEHRFSANALAYLRFRRLMQDDAFADWFGAATGLALAPTDDAGIHAMTPGDYLDPHSDAIGERALAFVLYLSPTWAHDDGGLLQVIEGSGAVTDVEPLFNRLIAFDVNADTTHRILPVRAGCRFTIGGWFRAR